MCNACIPGEDLTYDGRLAGGQDGHVHLRGVATDVENIITDQFFPGWFDINMPVEVSEIYLHQTMSSLTTRKTGLVYFSRK